MLSPKDPNVMQTLVRMTDSSASMLITDIEGAILFVNDNFCRLSGYTREELLGKNPRVLRSGTHDQAFFKNLWDTILSGKIWRDLICNKRKTGELIWLDTIISPILDENSKPKQFLVIRFDVTEQVQRDRLLKEQVLFQILVEGSPDAVILVDFQGKMTFANTKAVEIFAYPREELIGLQVDELIPGGFKESHRGLMKEFMMASFSKELGKGNYLSGRRKDGSEVPLEIKLTSVHTEGSKFILATLVDITERIEIEQERVHLLKSENAARLAAEKANLIKDEFLAMLSHELRTPLTTILSWTQLLRIGKLDADKAKRGIEILEQSARAQGQLIDDLLDISRIQAGKLYLNMQAVDPGKVIASAIDSIRSLAASKSVQIETELDPSIKTIFADPVRLQQIIWNLITNAIKFSPQGGRIWIKLDRIQSHGGEQFCIQVRDNGKGITPDFLPIIFERFTQVDCTTTRAYGGLGLGLAIVRKLVEMHGGTVSVESPGEGKGATFSISLPVKSSSKMITAEAEAEAEAEAAAEAEVSLKGLRVLVVEDDPSAREIFSILLQSFGAEVNTAASARECLAIIEGIKPDVLVSDIGMPIEDGYSLIRKIRALKSEVRQVPALALTAYAGQEDIQRVHLAGFQSHVAKPVDAKKLALAIARLIEIRHS